MAWGGRAYRSLIAVVALLVGAALSSCTGPARVELFAAGPEPTQVIFDAGESLFAMNTAGQVSSVIARQDPDRYSLAGGTLGPDGSVWWGTGPTYRLDSLPSKRDNDTIPDRVCLGRLWRQTPDGRRTLVAVERRQVPVDFAPSPDGQQLAYVTGYCSPPSDLATLLTEEAHVRNLRTGRDQVIAPVAFGPGSAYVPDVSVSWNPAGTRLLVTQSGFGRNVTTDDRAYLVTPTMRSVADGTRLTSPVPGCGIGGGAWAGNGDLDLVLYCHAPPAGATYFVRTTAAGSMVLRLALPECLDGALVSEHGSWPLLSLSEGTGLCHQDGDRAALFTVEDGALAPLFDIRAGGTATW